MQCALGLARQGQGGDHCAVFCRKLLGTARDGWGDLPVSSECNMPRGQNCWPCMRSVHPRSPGLLLLGAEMEGFCLPLGVPACEMCKMVPPFLEARTERGVSGYVGFSCPCFR